MRYARTRVAKDIIRAKVPLKRLCLTATFPTEHYDILLGVAQVSPPLTCDGFTFVFGLQKLPHLVQLIRTILIGGISDV